MNADRREDAKQHVGEDGDNSRRQETAVAHYRPWVLRERNQLCEEAGLAGRRQDDQGSTGSSSS